jgi:general secretion pathway protein L
MTESIWRKNITMETIAGAVRSFWSWYLAQAQGLRMAWMLDRGECRLVVHIEGDDALLSVFDGAGAPSKENPESSARDVLARLSRQGRPARVILKLPRERFLVRNFDAPAVARSALAQALAREVERKTLFRLDEVFLGHAIRPNAERRDTLRVTQWILRRDIARAAMERVGLTLDDLDLVRPTPDPESAEAPEDLVVSSAARGSPAFRRALIAMAALGLGLFVAAGGARAWRDYRSSAQIEQELESAAGIASNIRGMAAQATAESAMLNGLRSARANAPALSDLLEETARILPDSAYLTEWRLSETKEGGRAVNVSGLAASAADLPPLFDTSPLFFEAALTSAIVLDAQEKRERFSLRARVRSSKEAKAR